MIRAVAALLLMLPLASCLAGAVVGATVGVAGAVVGTAVKTTGAVVGTAVKTTGAVVDAAIPDDDEDDD